MSSEENNITENVDEENYVSRPLFEETDKFRKFKLNYDNIVLEDIEDQEIDVHVNNYGQLYDEELLDFVGIYFSNEYLAQDAYQIKHSTVPEINRHGARILWVENTQTGDLVPVARHISAEDVNGSSVIASGEEGDLEDARTNPEDERMPLLLPSALDNKNTFDSDSKHNIGVRDHSSRGVGSPSDSNSTTSKQDMLENEIAPIVAYHNMVMVQRGIFLVFQGLLAGFAFTSVFIYESANGSDKTFVTTYQPIAQYFRRFFYILASISLVGSFDMCLTIFGSSSFQGRNAVSNSNYNSNHRAFFAMSLNYDVGSFLLSLLIGLLYATSFITTILMSQFDVLTSLKDGGVSDWPDDALNDSKYHSSLDNWKGLNTVRLITSVLAWMGSCLFVWKDLIQLNAKSADLLRLREVMLAWSGRVKIMEGSSGIDKLSPVELRRLIGIMKVGIDRAQDAISFFEQQEEGDQKLLKNN